VLADTGALTGTSDALQASTVTGTVPSLLAGEALHATTIGWPDQVASEASLADVAVSVAGTAIGADSVMARALAILGSAGAGPHSSFPFRGLSSSAQCLPASDADGDSDEEGPRSYRGRCRRGADAG